MKKKAIKKKRTKSKKKRDKMLNGNIERKKPRK